jgi:hypothetical protein
VERAQYSPVDGAGGGQKRAGEVKAKPAERDVLRLKFTAPPVFEKENYLLIIMRSVPEWGSAGLKNPQLSNIDSRRIYPAV